MAAHLKLAFSKHFRDFRLHAHLEVRSGITTLVGPSGSGKTTLIRCLAGLETPEQGKIQLDDETWLDTACGFKMPIQQRRVGFVFNDHALFPEMTVARNVLFGARRQELAWEWLELLDIAALRDRLPRHLSAGQQQRVALARALSSEPRLLLMDEPFSSLDPHLKERVYAEFSSLVRRLPIPVLLVTHDLNEASLLSTTMIVLSQGQVLQQGAPSDVLLQPNSPDVARLAGYRNVFSSTADEHGTMRWGNHLLLAESAPEGSISWCVRSDRIEVVPAGDPRPNVLPAVVRAVHLTGAGCRLSAKVENGGDLELLLPIDSIAAHLVEGDRFSLRIPPEAIHFLAGDEAL